MCKCNFVIQDYLKLNSFAGFCLHLSVGEIKLCILFCYYVFTLFVYLTMLIVHIRSINGIATAYNKYVLCSAGGRREECDKYLDQYNAKLTPVTLLIMITFILSPLINLSHLMYMIHLPTVKRAFQKICK